MLNAQLLIVDKEWSATTFRKRRQIYIASIDTHDRIAAWVPLVPCACGRRDEVARKVAARGGGEGERREEVAEISGAKRWRKVAARGVGER